MVDMGGSKHLAENGDRHFAPCPSLQRAFDAGELVVTCDFCGRFFVRCCLHPDSESDPICHHYRVVYTDGACTDNGRDDAVSGIGFAFGEGNDQASIPVDDRLDPGGRRTNQRAELLRRSRGPEEDLKRKRRRDRDGDSYRTNSEYVAKGMTEWLPAWKKRGWRRSDGRRPSNLDLFCKLEAEVEARERRHDCKIKFWHVRREYNHIADGLAKGGARIASVDRINDSLAAFKLAAY
ncbi:ribonuclease H-like protein [Melanogaster broomeanus]|nr:ribonuclease H-like protein [Melanogaster broomeanus]